MGRNNDIELLDAGCCWRGAVGGGGGGNWNCSSIGESRLVSTLIRDSSFLVSASSCDSKKFPFSRPKRPTHSTSNAFLTMDPNM